MYLLSRCRISYECMFFPEPITCIPTYEPRVEVLAEIKVELSCSKCLAMLSHCLVKCYLCPLLNSIIVDVDGMFRTWWIHVVLD